MLMEWEEWVGILVVQVKKAMYLTLDVIAFDASAHTTATVVLEVLQSPRLDSEDLRARRFS